MMPGGIDNSSGAVRMQRPTLPEDDRTTAHPSEPELCLGTWRWTPVTDELHASDSLRRELRLPEDEGCVDRQAFLRRLHAEDRDSVRALLDLARLRAEDTTVRCRVLIGEGRVRRIESRVRVEKDAGGQVTTVKGIVYARSPEITAVPVARQLRPTRQVAPESGLAAARRRCDALQEHVDAMNSAISHDVRAPLRAIEGFAELLSDHLSGEADEMTLQYFGRIRAAALRMDGMIDDLLRWSRLDTTPTAREVVDLSAIATEIVEDLCAGDRRRGVDAIIAPQVRATGDPRLLRILLGELLENAWKFTSTRDPATIEFGRGCDPEGRLVYFVRDNGIGVDERGRDRIYRPFHRLAGASAFDGRGIGLAIASRIVAASGGRLWEDVDPTGGAVFRFTLG